jgi:hypothetical protein
VDEGESFSFTLGLPELIRVSDFKGEWMDTDLNPLNSARSQWPVHNIRNITLFLTQNDL